mmetsp:Transcript_25765/g.29451  ORF Transcript_25765/g.29451 Transcript_25765/m.29451 type:complete len:275 (+) Transcript_25765:155-979(+)
MDNSEDPYKILGVPRSATNSQIKSAYRKLALKHHPDRQADEASKHRATQIFSKISNAYEILGDENDRRQYDMQQQQNQQQNQQRRQHNTFFGSRQHHHHFHDPFDIFAQVFGDEFGTTHRSGGGDLSGYFPSPLGSGIFGGSHRDPFDDPFFTSGFGGSSGNSDPFSQVREGMNSFANNSAQSFFSSSSSSSTTNIRGGNHESISTTTRMINGKRQTVTERLITKPDGTTERHVETTGDEDFPQQQLPGWVSGQIDQPTRAQLPSQPNQRHSRY